MSGFASTIAAFKNTIATQEVIPKPRISPNNNNNTSLGSKSTLSTNKRKPKKSGFSQPVDTGPAEHTLSQFHRVLCFLKEKMDEPQTLEEINANKFKIRPNDELYNIMISSEKIEFDSANRTFKYKPDHSIRSKEDLLNLLKERNDKSTVPRGMQYKELNDCIDLSNAIAELEKEGKIMVIRLVKDSTPRLLFWNDLQYNTPMDKEFVKMFHSVKVPDETDLKKSLEDAGLQSMAVFENRGIIEDKPKQRKRKLNSRKTKIEKELKIIRI